MNAVGFSSQAAGRLFPAGISGWSAQDWEALTVTVIAVSVTSWVAFRKRSSNSSVSERRGNLAVEILLQVVILAGAMLVSYWNASNPEPFRVKGPDYPTLVHVGESVVLNCTVMTRLQEGGLEVEWRNLKTQAVILTCDDQEGPCRFYRDRVHLFSDRLQAGNMSVKLEGVQASDAGKYQCTVHSRSHSSHVVMDLSVVALGTRPSVSIEQFNESALVYTCQSEGWFPDPAVIWKDSDGNSLMPQSRVTMTTSKKGLYRLEVQHWTAQVVPPSVTCIVHSRVNNIKKVSAARTTDLLPHVQFHVGETEWSRIQGFSVPLTLDPDTANPWLVLTEDLLGVAVGSERQPVSASPRRLQLSPCVLASMGFASGQGYWEVEVGQNPTWDLGLLSQAVNRKARVNKLAGTGFWGLSRLSATEYRATDSPARSLVLNQEPSVLGVYLSHGRGHLSFYDADRRLHLRTVTNNLTGTLYPIFCPGPRDGPELTGPLRLRAPGQ